MIIDKSQELGRLIGQSDEYKSLRRAQERLLDAQELRQKLDRLHHMAETLERTAADGQQPSEAEAAEYELLLSSVQSDPVYQAVVSAQANFDKLMLRVNEQILDGIKQGSASPIITLS